MNDHGPAPSVDPDAERRASLLRNVLRAMAVLAAVGAATSFAEPRNDAVVTVTFYGLVYVALFALHRAIARGRVVLGAWAVSLFLWGLVALVTLFFGGLQGQNAAVFCGCTMLLASVAGGRAGLAMATGSIVWCGMIATLESRGALPRQLGPPYSPLNAWGAVMVTLVLVAVIMWHTQESMRQMYRRAVEAAGERDEALRRSIQAQKMELVGKLASGVAHDFNNLLTVITSASESLRGQVGDDRVEDRLALLAEIDDASTRATLLVRQLLAVGRAEPTPLTVLDLAAEVRSFARLLPRLVGPAIEVDVTLEEGSTVSASVVAVEQIVLNLVVNAREAMPEGGHLAVEVRRQGEEVLLVVRDDGVGIAPENRARLFTPFFTTKQTGTGLGLVTVHERVTQLGGRVEVDSPEGGGSRFTIHLPRVEVPATAVKSVRPESLPATTASRVVLVVDDEPLVRQAFVRMLRRAGYEVLTAENGVEALERFRERSDVCCVVSDVSMPRLDGRGLADELAVRAPELPVILVSGHSTSEPESSLRAFLPKPVSTEALTEAIARMTRTRS